MYFFPRKVALRSDAAMASKITVWLLQKGVPGLLGDLGA
jgi:hypothetical protein